jgi:hypothetical protein
MSSRLKPAQDVFDRCVAGIWRNPLEHLHKSASLGL